MQKVLDSVTWHSSCWEILWKVITSQSRRCWVRWANGQISKVVLKVVSYVCVIYISHTKCVNNNSNDPACEGQLTLDCNCQCFVPMFILNSLYISHNCLGTCLHTLTIGKSLRICIPSPGPMCAMWLKLVGLEINLFLISGSRSISLQEKIFRSGI